jgi:hypothetical protein
MLSITIVIIWLSIEELEANSMLSEGMPSDLYPLLLDMILTEQNRSAYSQDLKF